MNKVCPDCNYENKEESKFCAQCGKNLEPPVENTKIQESSSGNGLAGASIFFMLIVPICYGMLRYLLNEESYELRHAVEMICSLASPILGFVLMIFGRIIYRSNKFLKVYSRIIFVLIVLSVLLFLFLLHYVED